MSDKLMSVSSDYERGDYNLVSDDDSFEFVTEIDEENDDSGNGEFDSEEESGDEDDFEDDEEEEDETEDFQEDEGDEDDDDEEDDESDDDDDEEYQNQETNQYNDYTVNEYQSISEMFERPQPFSSGSSFASVGDEKTLVERVSEHKSLVIGVGVAITILTCGFYYFFVHKKFGPQRGLRPAGKKKGYEEVSTDDSE